MRTGKGIRMPLYEHVFMSRQDVSAQQVEELTAQLKGVIEQMGGKIAKLEQWGVKSLSYRLRKNRKAHFTFFNLDAPPAVINEIERQERLNEDVLRYLTVRVEEHEEGPSAMMRKVRPRRRGGGGGFRDRDRGGFRGDRDRGDRGDRGGYRGDRDRGDREAVRRAMRSARGDRGVMAMALHRPRPPAARSSAAARPVRSPAPMRRRSTTRTCGCCSATSPSAARSCRAASPRYRPRSSASWRRRSSARAFSDCCLT